MTPSTDLNHGDPPSPPNGTWKGDIDPFADPEERRVIFATLDSFRQYRRTTHFNTTHRRRQNLYALPTSHWQTLAAPPFSLLSTLNAVDDAIDANADIAEQILSVGLAAFGLPASPDPSSPMNWLDHATPNDHSKAHSTIRQFYRDWSREGASEIGKIRDTILSDLRQYLGDPTSLHHGASVLLPGAGLARLLLELCLNGYSTQGNEISYHQLLASNWILNHTSQADQYRVFPFATTFTNLMSRTHQLREMTIPDLHPGTAIAESVASGRHVGEISMVAGDFISVYSAANNKAAFNAVVSVFFIDTAPNPIRYIETVRNCLASGGIWINIGPLLWHFEDRISGHQERQKSENEHNLRGARGLGPPGASRSDHAQSETSHGIEAPGSVELTSEEIIQLLSHNGFEVLKSEILDQDAGYIQNPDSMLQNMYRCAHWVVKKL